MQCFQQSLVCVLISIIIWCPKEGALITLLLLIIQEQPGQEADARQTNDTCYRTKTIQNNFINSVTFLLCTSVQPYPSSLLLKIDNACFLFRIFLKGRHKTSHQCIIYTSATQSPTPKLIFSLTRYFQQNVNKHHGLSSASEVRL